MGVYVQDLMRLDGGASVLAQRWHFYALQYVAILGTSMHSFFSFDSATLQPPGLDLDWGFRFRFFRRKGDSGCGHECRWHEGISLEHCSHL